MPRSMSGPQLAAIQASEVQPAVFVQMGFNGVTVYLWSGVGSIAWNGQTWTGLGALLKVTAVEDAATVEARGINITLSGLDTTLLPDCLNDFQLGLPVTVYLDFYVSGVLTGSPLTTWAGRMDQPTIDVAAETATIAINCENRLMDMDIAVDRRYTLEDAQMEYPGDLGFAFTDGLQEQTLFWGNYPNTSNNI